MEKQVYKPLPMTTMRAGTICQPPGSYVPMPVRADTPAVEVMTDLRRVRAATIRADATLAQASQAMIASGVRLLLVVGLHGVIEGLITARDLMGEKPINLLHERGGKHKALTIADVMTPRSAIDVLEISTVQRAEVGDIVATLKDVGRQHALVVDRDPLTHEETLRGIFSATQIGRQLGVPILIFEVAHTFAEIESELAK
jgi:CBS domain-containing protein